MDQTTSINFKALLLVLSCKRSFRGKEIELVALSWGTASCFCFRKYENLKMQGVGKP